MTYYGGKDLASAFRTVRKNTIKIAEEVPEDKYDFRPGAGRSKHPGHARSHCAFDGSPKLRSPKQHQRHAERELPGAHAEVRRGAGKAKE